MCHFQRNTVEMKCQLVITGHFTCGGWMETHRLGPCRAQGQVVTSVTAAALRGTVTQCLSASAARAEQVVWDQ